MVGVTAGTPPHPDVPPTLTLQKQSRLPAATAPEEVLAGGACVGADCLLRVLANYSRSGEVKTTITVGVVGERGGSARWGGGRFWGYTADCDPLPPPRVPQRGQEQPHQQPEAEPGLWGGGYTGCYQVSPAPGGGACTDPTPPCGRGL